MATKKKKAAAAPEPEVAPVAVVAPFQTAGKFKGEEWGYRVIDESKVGAKYLEDGSLLNKAVRDFHHDAEGIVGGIEVVRLA